VILAWSGLAAAATLSVDPGDAEAYATVAGALGAAVDGDSVAIVAGTYVECLDTGGISVTLTGLDGSGSTALEGPDACDAVLSVAEGAVTLQGLTLENAHGRGLTVTGGSLEATDLVVTNSGRDDLAGGGAALGYGTVSLTDCTFQHNTAAHGGGLYVDQGVTLAMSSCVFQGNQALTSGGGVYAYAYNDLAWVDVTLLANHAADGSGGGAVVSWYTPLSLEGVVFEGNTASGTGGGLYLYATDADISMDRVSFSSNSAGSTGGGIEAVWWNRITVTDGLFEGNVAGGYGGAMTNWYEASLTVSGSTFSHNTAASSGGAIGHYPYGDQDLTVRDSLFTDNVSGGAGGAIWAVYGRDMILADNTFQGNRSGGGSVGGAVEIYVADGATVTGNHFCGNEGGYGGGLGIQWTGADTVANNVFQDNVALLGGGLYRYADYVGDIAQNTFVGNSASDWGGGYYTSWSYGTVANNVFAHTRAGNGVYAQEAGTASASLLWHDGWFDNAVIDAGGYFWTEHGRDGNVVADPGFMSWVDDGDCTNDDLRFGQASPFKDAGDPERRDLDGSVSDLGAWGGEGAPVEDRDGDGADTTTDCDDTSADIHPGAEDTPLDGVDQDCDGADAEPPPVDTGDTGDTGGPTGDTDATLDTEATDSLPEPADSGAPAQEESCGCASTAPRGSWAPWLLAGLVPWRRRA